MTDKKNAPLLNAIINYHTEKVSVFHTPGHKKGAGISKILKETYGHKVFNFDLTEVPGLDNLHSPTGVIREAENLAAQVFNVEKTFFLINGASSGILATILALFGPNDEILLPRNFHASVYHGLILSGAVPRYIYPAFSKKYGIHLGLKLEQVKEAFTNYPKAKGILLINPNYYGITSELENIVAYAKSLNKIVIVDEAHGAHFRFSDSLPKSSLEVGSDVTIQSTHKNLTSLTQTALLHVKGYQGEFRKISSTLSFIQSTSPSYILMASLDGMCQQLAQSGPQLVSRVVELACKVRDRLEEISGIRVLRPKDLAHWPYFELDPTKIVINVAELSLTGFQAESILREQHGIQVEMADSANIVVLLSVGDNDDSADQLVTGIKNMASKYGGKCKPPSSLAWLISQTYPKQILTPREAWQKEKEPVLLEDSVGRILGEEVTPYPPGIPLVISGELITEEILQEILRLKKRGCRFIGMQDQMLRLVQVLKEKF